MISSLVARVEVAGGLVGEDDVGVVDQRPGDRHALLLAAGELVGAVVEPVGEADHPGQLEGPLLVLLGDLAAALVGQRELDVLDDGVLLDQVVRLEDEADVAAPDLGELVVVELGDVAAAEEVLPLVGRSRQPSRLSMVLLPEPEVPHDGDVFALVEVDRDALEGVDGDGLLPAAAASEEAASAGAWPITYFLRTSTSRTIGMSELFTGRAPPATAAEPAAAAAARAAAAGPPPPPPPPFFICSSIASIRRRR